MTRGRLIVFEGPEGAGKTTQLRLLGAWLADRGTDHVAVREPGGTQLGDAVRALVLDAPAAIDPRAEALLFMASRAELVATVVLPALDRGAVVLADRFFLSTYAYQVAGRGLDEREIRTANALATRGVEPDLTLVFTAPSAARQDRAARRGAPDRIERAGDAFHARVEQAFAAFLTPAWQAAHPETGPIAAVDADDTEPVVFERVLAALGEHLPELAPAGGAAAGGRR